MDELTLDNAKYLSSKRAAQVTGYAKDYVGQLCREGRVNARLVGRNWYVLETSILEHRFGSEEADEPVIAAEKSVLTTWEAPRYISEPVAAVPQLSPKPATLTPLAPIMAPTEPIAPLESARVLGDMQSAWKEWFEREEKALPDASSMLLEEHSEVPEAENEAEELTDHRTEVGGEQETVRIQRKEEETEEAPVNIERVRPEPLQAMRKDAIFDLRTERSAGMQVSTSSVIPKASRLAERRAPKKGSFALQALFVGIALVAIAITALGSGVFDGYFGNSKATWVTDFFAGKQHVGE